MKEQLLLRIINDLIGLKKHNTIETLSKFLTFFITKLRPIYPNTLLSFDVQTNYYLFQGHTAFLYELGINSDNLMNINVPTALYVIKGKHLWFYPNGNEDIIILTDQTKWCNQLHEMVNHPDYVDRKDEFIRKTSRKIYLILNHLIEEEITYMKELLYEEDLKQNAKNKPLF